MKVSKEAIIEKRGTRFVFSFDSSKYGGFDMGTERETIILGNIISWCKKRLAEISTPTTRVDNDKETLFDGILTTNSGGISI